MNFNGMVDISTVHMPQLEEDALIWKLPSSKFQASLCYIRRWYLRKYNKGYGMTNKQRQKPQATSNIMLGARICILIFVLNLFV